MEATQVLWRYLLWHYTKAFADLWHFFENLLWAVYNIFSIFFLLRSLFSPFERVHEKYGSSIDAEDFFENIMANIILRLVGAILRLCIIVIGLVLLLLTCALEIIAFIAWPLLPFAALGLLIFGVGALM